MRDRWNGCDLSDWCRGLKVSRDALDITLRSLLLPVLLGQAVYVRRNYMDLPEPTGPRSGVVGQGPPLRVLITGDSSAVGLGVETQEDALLGQLTARLAPHATVTYDLVAKSGAKTSDVLGWLGQLPQARYDVVITALGVNDVTKGVSLRRFLALQSALMDRLASEIGAQKIVISGLPPIGQFPLLPQPLSGVLGRQAARFDRHLDALVAGRADCTLARVNMALDATNMSKDGFHPGPAVYAAWAKVVAGIILGDRETLDATQAAP